jgi:hypothetical protein
LKDCNVRTANDSRDQRARTGHLGQESQDRTAVRTIGMAIVAGPLQEEMAGLPGQLGQNSRDSQPDRADGSHQPGQDREERIART